MADFPTTIAKTRLDCARILQSHGYNISQTVTIGIRIMICERFGEHDQTSWTKCNNYQSNPNVISIESIVSSLI